MNISKLVVTAMFVLVTLMTGCTHDIEVGSKERPFTMYFVPSREAGRISTNADKMAKYMEQAVSQKLYGKNEGFYVKSSVPTSYVAVIEALGTGKADFAGFSTFAYVLAKDIKKYDIEAVLKVVRFGTETSYKGQIITHVDSGINKLEDLNGKKFAYTDAASTAGYIIPAHLLQERKIELSDVVFAQKHDNVVSMVYNRQVDAGATFHSPPKIVEENGVKKEIIRDARRLVLTQYPDVVDKVKIVDFTQDIPNAPWVIRGNLMKDQTKNSQIKKAVVEALLDLSKTDDGKEMLVAIQDVNGLVEADDASYADLRKALTMANLDLEEMLHAKDKKKKK